MKRKYEKIISEAVKRAQIISSHNGFTVGQIVCHPSEPLACELKEIINDKAILEVNNIRQQFPLNEIFDPNIAMEEALKIQKGLN